MSNKRVLSFSVCANGDLQINVPKGHRLIVDQSDPTRVCISANPSIWATNETAPAAVFEDATKIGGEMKDGSIYAGVSPENKRSFFLPAVGFITKQSANTILEYLRTCNFHGHDDWQLASPKEYRHLFKNRNVNGVDAYVQYPRAYWTIDGKTGGYYTIHPRKGRVAYKSGQRYFLPVRYGFPETPLPR